MADEKTKGGCLWGRREDRGPGWGGLAYRGAGSGLHARRGKEAEKPSAGGRAQSHSFPGGTDDFTTR